MSPKSAHETDGEESRRAGPIVRTDIVDVYVFARRAGSRAGEAEVVFLQGLRADEPLEGTWHPVMGHLNAGESAVAGAKRELLEETGLECPSADSVGMWALEQVHPYYIPALECIMMSARFAVEARYGWTPRVSREDAGFRWVPAEDARERFIWPGQRAAVEEIMNALVLAGSEAQRWMRVQ